MWGQMKARHLDIWSSFLDLKFKCDCVSIILFTHSLALRSGGKHSHSHTEEGEKLIWEMFCIGRGYRENEFREDRKVSD